jgi:hypothetical protein
MRNTQSQRHAVMAMVRTIFSLGAYVVSVEGLRECPMCPNISTSIESKPSDLLV